MKISVNNKEVETAVASVSALLEELSITPQGVAVAVNNKLVPRGEWDTFTISEGMSLVVIKAACGG